MTIDVEDLLNSIEESFSRMTYIKAEEIPDIDLYMDQVTTFLDERLKRSARVQTDEKLMTKTMINNYAKNDVIPPPIRKKYNKEHLLLLTMIYYFKSFLQINDIKELMDPISNEMFGNKENYSVEEVYRGIFKDKHIQLDEILEDVKEKYKDAMTTFDDAPKDEQDYLKFYSFICKLGCDVFVKKLLIEKAIDSLRGYHDHEKSDTTEN